MSDCPVCRKKHECTFLCFAVDGFHFSHLCLECNAIFNEPYYPHEDVSA